MAVAVAAVEIARTAVAVLAMVVAAVAAAVPVALAVAALMALTRSGAFRRIRLIQAVQADLALVDPPR